MKVLVNVATIFIFIFASFFSHAKDDSAKQGDVVILFCATGGTPSSERIISDSRSANAGTPTSSLTNCAVVISDLLQNGFVTQKIIGDPLTGTKYIFYR